MDASEVQRLALIEANRKADVPFIDGPYWQEYPQYLVREQFIRDHVPTIAFEIEHALKIFAAGGYIVVKVDALS